jgi:hypothetical protein
METSVLAPFVKHEVEILVAGVWIPGVMTPIVKGVITLLPTAETAAFYGPTAIKAEVVQAIRQVKRSPQANVTPNATQPVASAVPVRSALESGSGSNPGQHPGSKFVHR